MMSCALFQPQPMMMGYGVPQSIPGHLYMMAPPGHDSRMSSLLQRPPPVIGAASPAATAAKASSVTGGPSLVTPRDVPTQSFMSSSTAAPGGPTAGATKSKQGLEKILDTLSKMFPDVRRLVAAVLCDLEVR